MLERKGEGAIIVGKMRVAAEVEIKEIEREGVIEVVAPEEETGAGLVAIVEEAEVENGNRGDR